MSATAKPLRLDRDRTCVLLIDWQQRLCQAMDPDEVEETTRWVRILLEGARALGLPVVVTEQYPKGLGSTLEELQPSLEGIEPIPKVEFSALANSEAAAALEATGRDQVLVAGMEAHICVYQTVLDLVDSGRTVHVMQDATLSRGAEDYGCGLALSEAAGAVISTVETALFQLLGKAGGDAFKTISRLIR